MNGIDSSAGLLAIVGPTASGKSEVALTVAASAGAEILACDSVQVYRGFDIGCAKPTRAEQEQVRHHLVDVVDWSDAFDAQRYCTLALDAIADAALRGKRVILCGGTGLYLRALRYGLIDAPERDLTLRESLYAEEQTRPGVLYDRLQKLDPVSARSIEPKNLVHVVRALEIYTQTGELPSVLKARHGFTTERLPMRVVAIDWPREVLRERIRARTEAMLAAGLVDEVRGLIERGVPTTCRPMRAVGYREVCEWLEGEAEGAACCATTEDLAQRIARATWEYARRQYTWLRKEKGVVWISAAEGIGAVSTHIVNHEGPLVIT